MRDVKVQLQGSTPIIPYKVVHHVNAHAKKILFDYIFYILYI